jgi:hypothetical protein
MKIIVETEKQKQEILKQSEYIHDFLINEEDVKSLDKNWLIGLDPDKAGILMHLYMAPEIIEVDPKINDTEISNDNLEKIKKAVLDKIKK